MRTKNRLLLAGALLLSTLGMATSAGANSTSCVPFNMYWNECTTTYYDPHTQTWVSDIWYQPVRVEDSIDP